MKQFPERKEQLDYDEALGFAPCMKKPIAIEATPINEEFRVKTLEGDYKLGKPGDYLMCGIDDELYICDKEIFEKSYDWL